MPPSRRVRAPEPASGEAIMARAAFTITPIPEAAATSATPDVTSRLPCRMASELSRASPRWYTQTSDPIAAAAIAGASGSSSWSIGSVRSKASRSRTNNVTPAPPRVSTPAPRTPMAMRPTLARSPRSRRPPSCFQCHHQTSPPPTAQTRDCSADTHQGLPTVAAASAPRRAASSRVDRAVTAPLTPITSPM